jgi:hypothetical protein
MGFLSSETTALWLSNPSYLSSCCVVHWKGIFSTLRTKELKKSLLLEYKNQVRTSKETHYVCAKKLCRSMLCKIWGFHGSDYEECRLLGHKNPARTSQETYYIYATESSQLMLCKIWGFHGGDYEECRLLGCKTQFVLHRRHITSTLQSPAG